MLNVVVTPLTIIVKSDTALKLRAVLDHTDGGKRFIAGDERLFEGPGTYTSVPRYTSLRCFSMRLHVCVSLSLCLHVPSYLFVSLSPFPPDPPPVLHTEFDLPSASAIPNCENVDNYVYLQAIGRGGGGRCDQRHRHLP